MAHLDRPATAAPRGSHAPHPPVRYSTPALSDKRLAPTQRPDFAQAVVALAQANGKAAVMINDDAQLAHAVGAQGLHLSSSRLWEIDQLRISSGSPPRVTEPPIWRGQPNSVSTLSSLTRCCRPPATRGRTVSAGRSLRAGGAAYLFFYPHPGATVCRKVQTRAGSKVSPILRSRL